MADTPETHSWHIEFKNGANTSIHDAVDGDLLVADDVVELFSINGERLFAAPFSSIVYMKRIEPRGKPTDFGIDLVGEDARAAIEQEARRRAAQ